MARMYDQGSVAAANMVGQEGGLRDMLLAAGANPGLAVNMEDCCEFAMGLGADIEILRDSVRWSSTTNKMILNKVNPLNLTPNGFDSKRP